MFSFGCGSQYVRARGGTRTHRLLVTNQVLAPGELLWRGALTEIRTRDLILTMDALFHWSYQGVSGREAFSLSSFIKPGLRPLWRTFRSWYQAPVPAFRVVERDGEPPQGVEPVHIVRTKDD